MTWQEELRQLDAALANGEVSAGDYRRRRDEILATASSAQSPAPSLTEAAFAKAEVDNTTELADQTQTINTDTDADATQVVSSAESTQVVNSAESTQVVSVDRTQVVTEAEQTQIISQTQQAPTWASHLPDPSAPTGSFPRQPGPMNPAMTPMQAHDVFSGGKEKSAKKGWIIALVVVLVLAAGGFAGWWFLLKDKDNGGGNQADKSSTAPPSSQDPPPAKSIDEITLPGEVAANGGELTIQEAREKVVIGDGEAGLLEQAGVTELTYSGSSEGDFRFLLYSYPSADADAAATTTDAVNGVQQELGLSPVDIADLPDGVTAAQLTNAQASVIRAVYTSGENTIQLSVLQVPAGDEQALHKQFTEVLAMLTDEIPPTT